MKKEQKRKLRTILGKVEILQYEPDITPGEFKALGYLVARLRKLYNKA
jgi:hypothetical protein